MGLGDHLRQDIAVNCNILCFAVNDRRMGWSRFGAPPPAQNRLPHAEPFGRSHLESARFIPEGGCGHVACRRSSGGATETGEPRRRSGRDIAAPTMGYRLSFPRLPGWRLAASLILPGPNCGMIALRGEKSLLVEFRHAACRQAFGLAGREDRSVAARCAST
jgi:hypothetical protein